jgi:hypothetical protein
MDPSLIAQQQAAQAPTFQMQFQEAMFYIGPIAQVAYWLGMLLFVGYAVVQYKRWVNFQMGVGKSGALNTAKTVAADEAVKVDEFVE